MKTFLKHLIIPVLASRPVSSLGTLFFGSGIPVFMIHRMQTGKHPYKGTAPEYLRRCLQYLVDRDYHFVSIEEIVYSLIHKTTLPTKSVAFTMDDGYWDQAEIAAPIFREFNCPATLFVITGMLDRLLWPWDAKVAHLIDTSNVQSLSLSLGNKVHHFEIRTAKEKNIARETIRNHIKSLDANDTDKLVSQLATATGIVISDTPPQHFRPMSWDAARQLEQNGIKIAPHTVSHRILSQLDSHTAEQEIVNSWQRLNDELKSPSPVFCYPTGRNCDYGAREIEFLIKNKFVGAVSTSPGYIMNNDPTSNYNYNLPRFTLPSDFYDFTQYCSWIEHMKIIFRSSHN